MTRFRWRFVSVHEDRELVVEVIATTASQAHLALRDLDLNPAVTFWSLVSAKQIEEHA